jgi:hypothetical protein
MKEKPTILGIMTALQQNNGKRRFAAILAISLSSSIKKFTYV